MKRIRIQVFGLIGAILLSADFVRFSRPKRTFQMKARTDLARWLKVAVIVLATTLTGPAYMQELKAHDKQAQERPQENQKVEDDQLLEEILAAQAEGEESLRAWIKTNKDRVTARWILHLAQRGSEERNEKFLNLALLLAQEKGDETCLAESYLIAGKYHLTADGSSALDYYAKALVLFQKQQSVLGQAKAYLGEGLAHNLMGQYQKSLDVLNQALPNLRAAGDHTDEAKALNGLGAAYSRLGERQKALAYYEQALTIVQATGDRANEGQTLSNIGSVCSLIGDQQKALGFLNQALAIRRAIGDQQGEGQTLLNIGNAYYYLSDWQKALDSWNQALQIFRAVGDRVHEAGILNNMGGVYTDLGENRKAIESLEQALPIERAIHDRSGEAATLDNTGRAYAALGEKQKAIEYFSQSVAIAHANGNRQSEANALNDMGRAYVDLGERQKALEYCNQALAISRAIGDQRGAATALGNLGAMYAELGDNQKALDFFQQELVIDRALGNRAGESWALVSMGIAHNLLKERDKALGYFEQALVILRDLGDRSDEAETLCNMGEAYIGLGEQQKALEHYQKALEIGQALGDQNREAAALHGIGLVYCDLAEHRKALEYLNQALLIEHANGYRVYEAETSRIVMEQWNAISEPRLATLYGKQAVNLCQLMRASIAGLDQTTQQTYLKTVEGTYRELADILAAQGRLWEAQQVLQLLKEEEYFEFVRRDATTAKELRRRADLTPAEKTALERYEAIGDKVAAIGRRVEELRAVRTRTEEQEAELRQLKEELNVAGKAFQVALRQIEDDLGANRGARDVVEDLRATKGLGLDLRGLGADIVVVSTVVSEKNVWVILTTPTIQVAGKTDISAADLNRKALAFREALLHPDSDPRPIALEFYNILIKPVERELADASPKTVLWVLDGTLRYLPVAALYDGRHYLVERFASVELTLASRSRLTVQPGASWRALGFGVTEAHEGFRDLPAVVDELRAVVREEGAQGSENGALPGRRLLNREFTRQALEASRESGYQVVHIASHFSFRPGNATQSFLLLGDGSHLTVEDIREEGEPLFAGVELLTLSACDTAMGGEQADGREVEGLGVEAQNQGAFGVLATLWPVVDESTAQLMGSFYRGRQEEKLSKAEALRQAQLTLLLGRTTAPRNSVGAAPTATSRLPADPTKPYAHPGYWAPFILMGNWR